MPRQRTAGVAAAVAAAARQARAQGYQFTFMHMYRVTSLVSSSSLMRLSINFNSARTCFMRVRTRSFSDFFSILPAHALRPSSRARLREVYSV